MYVCMYVQFSDFFSGMLLNKSWQCQLFWIVSWFLKDKKVRRDLVGSSIFFIIRKNGLRKQDI